MEFTSIAEQLLFTVIRIETSGEKGKESVGTGLLFNYVKKNENYPFIVTCKHVVSGARKGNLTFIRGKGKERPVCKEPLLGNAFQLTIEDFEAPWFLHKSEAIDVAILPFAPILDRIAQLDVGIFFKHIPNDLIPKDSQLEELDAVEDVLFIGYPLGLWDNKNFLPIVRKGITATPVFLDFKGMKQFLIDASVFPGSSGSPVFIYYKGMYWDKKTKGTTIGHRIFFLGMLSEVFMMPVTGEIVVPTQTKPTVKVNQLADIGVVFRAETILEAVEDLMAEKGY